MKRERLLNAIGQIDDRLISGANPEIQARKKKALRQWVAALAACLALILCIGVVAPTVLGNREAGTVTMEINPGVEYTITRNGNVKSVRFLNDDAKEVLGEVSLKGQSLKKAVAFTIAAYKTGGYMDKNDTVLISFDKKLSENGELRATVAEDVRQALKDASSVHTLVYVSETDDANTAELAKKYNISQGKAKLVGDAAENSELSVDEIVKLPLDELVGLQKEVDSVVIDSKYIGMTKAKAIALNDAGCEFRVEFTEATLIDAGVKIPYYRLVFRDKNTQWTYHINAINGDVIEKNATVMFISLEEAREIAFKDAGIDGSEKVVFTKEELSRNQGRPCWVLEFYTSKFEYVYKIDAKTGEIIYFDYHIDIRRAKGIAMTDAGCGDKVMFTVEKLVSGGIKTPYYYFVFNDDRTQWTYRINAIFGTILEKNEESLFISLEKAREIALHDAEIADGEKVVFTKEELNRNQGRPCWVLEFHTGKYSYVYKIDAKTGEVLFGRRYIALSRAKEIALDDSGCPDSKKIVFTTEELVDGGIKTPYYIIAFNNGETYWTYRINAVSGAILEKSEESLFISLEKAREIALNDAEIADGEKVVFTKEELSRNQGRPCWVLEFHTGKYSYVYKIDAKTGEVLFGRRYIALSRAKEIALDDSGCPDSKKIVFTTEELVDGGIKTPYYIIAFNNGETYWTYRINAVSGAILEKSEKTPFISLEKARAIALQDANLPDAEKYVFTREELSRNQGRPCWILEFYTSKFEYVYKIDAKTGEIIYFDYHIDILKAKKIAIDDAGCDGKVTFTEEKLVSGGIKTPYYHFVFNDGRTQWTYRIDATLGIVLEKSKASLIKAS